MEEFYSKFTIAADIDIYHTPRLVDTITGKRVRFVAHQVPGMGWTVAQVTGSLKTGRSIEPVAGYCETYTMHQAGMAAESLARDTYRAVQI